MTPEWTILNVAIQAIGGFLGAHAAATAAQEHRFGFVGHSVVGLVAGVLSGFFLQRIVMTTVNGTGDAMPMTALEVGIYQVVAGLAVGGIAMLAIGMLRHETKRNPGNSD